MPFKLSPTRYPYTYAYDYIREVRGGLSRADCARMVTALAAEKGVLKDDLCKRLADAYISKWTAIYDAEDQQRETIETLGLMVYPCPSEVPSDGR